MTVGLRQENRTVMVSFKETANRTLDCMGVKPLPPKLHKPLCALNPICQEAIFVGEGNCFEMQLSCEQLLISTQNYCWQANPH
jgi:hypothetical protein